MAVYLLQHFAQVGSRGRHHPVVLVLVCRKAGQVRIVWCVVVAEDTATISTLVMATVISWRE